MHEHVFFNPSGLAFTIRCFRQAPGCLVQGAATDAFTWFAGYHWRLALCKRCLTHLGWRFETRDDRFFALISDRLLE